MSTVDHVPDIGYTNQGVLTQPVLQEAHVTLCVRAESFSYSVKGATPTSDCSRLGAGYTALTSALSIRPANGKFCYSDQGNSLVCRDPNYALNVAFKPGEAALHVVPGNGSGTDAPPETGESAQQILQRMQGITGSSNANPTQMNAGQRAELSVQRQQEIARLAPDVATNLDAYWSNPVQSAGAFDARSSGKAVVVEGTVSRVEVASDGDLRAHIFFTEALHSDITGCVSDPGLLRNAYGADFSGLIGKTLRIAGVVEHACGPRADIRIVDARQLRVMAAPAAAATGETSPPDGLGPKAAGRRR